MARDDKPALIALALILVAILALAAFEIGFRNITGQQPPNSESSWVDGNENEKNPPGLSENGHVFGDSWAQWIMAFFTALATGISAVAVKLVNDTLRTSRTATEAALAANRTAKDIGLAQIRAYVSLVGLTGSFDPNTRSLEVSLGMTNSGQSPARKITCRIWIVRQDEDGREVLTAGSGTYDDPVDLMPSEQRPIFYEKVEFWDYVNDPKQKHGMEAYAHGRTKYFLRGFVTYNIVKDNFRRHTDFNYRIQGNSDSSIVPLRFHRENDGNESN